MELVGVWLVRTVVILRVTCLCSAIFERPLDPKDTALKASVTVTTKVRDGLMHNNVIAGVCSCSIACREMGSLGS